jgi:2-oxoisovalerate dehydrogenase E1 component
MLILIRQGKVSKWFSGIGQEAISGVTAVLDQDEYILPIRVIWGFTGRSIPLPLVFNGKEKLMVLLKEEIVVFILVQQYKIIGMISHWVRSLGCRRIALANKLKKNGKITVFTVKVRHPKETFMKHLILLRFGNYQCVCHRIMVTDFRPHK